MSKKKKKYGNKSAKPKPKTKKELTQKMARRNLNDKLQSIYHDEISLETTCDHQCACCNVAMPQINYSEFVNIATTMWDDMAFDDKINLICTSIEYFFRYEYEKWEMESLIKPCMFLNQETGMCKIYSVRPLSCFLPETLVFTKQGAKHIKDILTGEFVYGHDGHLHKVLATHSKLYNGHIYNVRTQGNGFHNWCTEDHLWLTAFHKDKRVKVKSEWTEAKDLVAKYTKKKGHYVCFPKEFEDTNLPEPKTLDLRNYIDGDLAEAGHINPFTSGQLFDGFNYHRVPRHVEVDDEFLFMVGLYLAEGSSSTQSTSFTMHINEKKHLDRVKLYLENIWGLETHYNKMKTGKKTVVLRVDSCLFGRFMTRICGRLSYEKAINGQLFAFLNHSELFKIFEGWYCGDGRKCLSEDEYSGITTSEFLAAQMEMILLSNGIFPQIYKSERTTRSHASYDVHVFPSNFKDVKAGQGTKRMYDDDFVYNPVDTVDKSYYYGPVVDIQVEDSESFITPSGIVHNCRMYGLWPEDEYDKRVDKFAEAYAEYGLKREDLPLHKQCPLVRRKDNSVELTAEAIDELYTKIDKLDKVLGNFTDLQIETKENYRTFHDWLLLKIYGEEWLSSLTTFMLAADKVTIQDQIKAIKDAIVEGITEKHLKDTFKDD